MPSYDYRCVTCGHTDTLIKVPYDDRDPKECPLCKGSFQRQLALPLYGRCASDKEYCRRVVKERADWSAKHDHRKISYH